MHTAQDPGVHTLVLDPPAWLHGLTENKDKEMRLPRIQAFTRHTYLR